MKLHQNSFHALRLYAALLVVFGHSADLLAAPAPIVFNRAIHGLGVDIFFGISGYLIAASLISDSNPFRFFAKRALRLLPALWINVVLTLLVFSLISTLTWGAFWASPTTTAFLKNLDLSTRYTLPGVLDQNHIQNFVNGSLWTLPVAAGLYVSLFFMFMLGRG